MRALCVIAMTCACGKSDEPKPRLKPEVVEAKPAPADDSQRLMGALETIATFMEKMREPR